MLLSRQRPGISEASLVQQGGSTEALQQIMAEREQRTVGYEEAQEVGASLIEFYRILAEEACDEAED